MESSRSSDIRRTESGTNVKDESTQLAGAAGFDFAPNYAPAFNDASFWPK